MKNTIYIVAFFILFKPILPVLEYCVNYDYIVTELCENKDKPKLECNGKCHLKKELAHEAQSENPKSNEQNTPILTLELLFCEKLPEFIFRFQHIVEKNSILYTNPIYNEIGLSSIFHPPILN